MRLSHNTCRQRRCQTLLFKHRSGSKAITTKTINVMRIIAEHLGHKLNTACQRNDVAQVAVLTAKTMDDSKWVEAILAAASERALDVASYCMRTGDWISTTDRILVLVLYRESLEPAYRFLVDSNFVNPEHCIDRYGQLLGAAAGLRNYRRWSLVEYLLKKGVSPDHTVDMYCGKFALAAAAGFSDSEMVGLLLDHGAMIRGSGALLTAAETGKEENVKYLLSRGADVSLKDPKGRTAGEIAATAGMDGSILAKLDTSC